MISNNSSSPIDWGQEPDFTELGCSGASQSRGEPMWDLSKGRGREGTEEKPCSLVARSQQSQDLVLILPTLLWLDQDSSLPMEVPKHCSKELWALVIKCLLVGNLIDTNRDDTQTGILTPPKASPDKIRWKAGIPSGYNVAGTAWGHCRVLRNGDEKYGHTYRFVG